MPIKQKKAILLFLVLFTAIAAIIELLLNISTTFISESTPQYLTQTFETLTTDKILLISVTLSLFITLCATKQTQTIIATLIFISIQVLCALIPAAYDAFTNNDITSPDKLITIFSITLIVSSILSTVCFALIKYINLKTEFSTKHYKWYLLPLCIIAVNPALISIEIFNEYLNLDNYLEEEFIGMASNPIGIISICLVGPIAEEVLFRGIILKSMTRCGITPWLAITTSALVFGTFHGNPIQVPFAFIAGLYLGIIYYHSGNLIAPTICHILNNTFSVILMNIYSDTPDITMSQIMGNETISTATAILTIIISIILLYIYIRKLTPRSKIE